jgi:Lon protease-like protein
MQGELLPLFALNVVLFPRTVLPLHIFEDRYKEMVGEAIRNNSEFGVVLVREQGIVNVGCTATVEKVLKHYPDGRMDIRTLGRRRFEIILLNEEKSYLRGPVQFFDDEESAPAPLELRKKAVESIEGLCSLGEAVDPGELPIDDPQLSFLLAQFLPDLDFRQTLLNTRSEAQRIALLLEFLEDYVPRRRYTAAMSRLAPRNGHGRRPPTLEDQQS